MNKEQTSVLVGVLTEIIVTKYMILHKQLRKLAGSTDKTRREYTEIKYARKVIHASQVASLQFVKPF